jgi:hypothetical protein
MTFFSMFLYQKLRKKWQNQKKYCYLLDKSLLFSYYCGSVNNG